MNQTIPAPLTSLCGVEFPAWLPVFDCRWSDDIPLPKDPSGQVTIYGSERAEYALGLRSYERGEYHSSCPVSIQAYTDSRNPRWNGEAARWLRDLLERAESERVTFDALGESWMDSDTGRGGTSCHMPVAVALSNFGACLIADSRQYRVKFFQD